MKKLVLFAAAAVAFAFASCCGNSCENTEEQAAEVTEVTEVVEVVEDTVAVDSAAVEAAEVVAE